MSEPITPDPAPNPAPPVEPPKGAKAPEPTPDPVFSQADVDRIVKDRLDRAVKKFSDYDDLKKAAGQSEPLQEQITALQKALADKDVADLERNGRLALSQVHTKLAEAGIKREDVETVLEQFDPVKLLTDGQPDDKAIEKFATALSRVAGRATPDPDQGKKGGEPSDMNSLIRGMAGRN